MKNHNDNFEQGCDDLDKANQALDEGKILKGLFYGGKGIVVPVAEVFKNPLGFIFEWFRD